MPDFSWANQWLNCREFIPILATNGGLGEPPADGLQHFTASDGPTPPQQGGQTLHTRPPLSQPLRKL